MFAIAITLLVLDIAVPESALHHLWHGIGHQWPSYLGYVTSFLTIDASICARRTQRELPAPWLACTPNAAVMGQPGDGDHAIVRARGDDPPEETIQGDLAD